MERIIPIKGEKLSFTEKREITNYLQTLASQGIKSSSDIYIILNGNSLFRDNFDQAAIREIGDIAIQNKVIDVLIYKTNKTETSMTLSGDFNNGKPIGYLGLKIRF